MKLSSFEISSLRNIASSSFDNLGDINIISGPNGSGKSSILEAIHILGTAKSFRSSSFRPVIMFGEKDCTVFGSLINKYGDSVSLGVKKNISGSHQIRIDGADHKGASNLARSLPIQTIYSGTYSLLEGGPKHRRQCLDWGVFHVEQEFYDYWKKFQRVLKQRNICLRENKGQLDIIDAWNNKFIELGTSLDVTRKQYFKELKPIFENFVSSLLNLSGLTIEFCSGWDKFQTLEEVTFKNILRDFALGVTHSGPHRSDIKVNVNGVNAGQVLSRGQQKLVIYALKLAQCQLMNSKNISCLLLIDDLPAEVDSAHQEKLCKILGGLDVQLFLTSIYSADLSGRKWSPKKTVFIFELLGGEVKNMCLED